MATSGHVASLDLTQEEDDEIVDIENRARPRHAAFLPGEKYFQPTKPYSNIIFNTIWKYVCFFGTM